MACYCLEISLLPAGTPVMSEQGPK